MKVFIPTALIFVRDPMRVRFEILQESLHKPVACLAGFTDIGVKDRRPRVVQREFLAQRLDDGQSSTEAWCTVMAAEERSMGSTFANSTGLRTPKPREFIASIVAVSRAGGS